MPWLCPFAFETASAEKEGIQDEEMTGGRRVRSRARVPSGGRRVAKKQAQFGVIYRNPPQFGVIAAFAMVTLADNSGDGIGSLFDSLVRDAPVEMSAGKTALAAFAFEQEATEETESGVPLSGTPFSSVHSPEKGTTDDTDGHRYGGWIHRTSVPPGSGEGERTGG
jgi:hypothetical protein